MRDLSPEALSLIEDDVEWLEDAARHYESFGEGQCDSEKLVWELLAAVFRERATFHQGLAEKMRSQVQLKRPDMFCEWS